jgi:hypothetical protein
MFTVEKILTAFHILSAPKDVPPMIIPRWSVAIASA